MSRSRVNAGEAVITLGVLNEVDKGLKAAAGSFRKFGKNLVTMGGALTGAAASMLAAPIALGSQLEETMGKFNTVFGENASAVEAWSNETARAMGISQQSMAGMLSGMQDLLVPMGVAEGTATGMSKTLSELAVDLGSFNNLEPATVFTDLQAAMTGSGEVMKKYGVILSQAAVNQELLNMGMDPKEATEAAKAQARLAIIMRGTTAAQGDALRTAGSFANQSRRLRAALADTGASIGSTLMPILAGMLERVNGVVSRLREWVDQNPGLVKAVTTAVLAVGALGVAITTAGAAFLAGGAILSGLAAALAFLISPIGLVIAAVVGMGAVIFAQFGSVGEALDWLGEMFGDLFASVKHAVNAIGGAIAEGNFAEAWGIALDFMESLWVSFTNLIRDRWDGVVNWVLDLTVGLVDGIASMFKALGNFLGNLLEGYKKWYNEVFNFVTEKVGEMSGVRTVGGPVDAFSGTALDTNLSSAVNAIGNVGAKFSDTFRSAVDEAKKDRAKSADERKARLAALRQGLKDQSDAVDDAKKERKKLGEPSAVKELANNLLGEQSIFGKAVETTRGGFSSAGAMFMGTAQSVQDKQLQAMQATQENTAKLVKNTNEQISASFA